MWKKINHGGEPTKNIDKKYAIFVGRYQPYHFGHIELIKQKLNMGIPALIMVVHYIAIPIQIFQSSITIF